MQVRRVLAGWLFVGWFAAMPVLAGWAAQRALQRNAGPDAQNWPQWRGPEGNGVSHAVNLPVTWGPDKNIAWKTPLPSWSGGTPVIWGDRIFVTSASKPAAAATDSAPQAPPPGPPPGPPGQGPGGARRAPAGGFGGERGGHGRPE